MPIQEGTKDKRKYDKIQQQWSYEISNKPNQVV